MPLSEMLNHWQKVKEIFENAHPNYCRKCWGWGMTEDTIDRDTDISNHDVCEECFAAGKCPHCSGELVLLEDGATYVCPCGWIEDTSVGIPDGPDPVDYLDF